MKKTILLLSLAVVTALPSGAFAHNHSKLTVNTKVSNVDWVGKKVSGQHTGTINIKEGSISLHDGHLSGGTVIMDMSSIAVTDITAEQGGDKLKGHLNSPDFFDAAKHQTATLTINSYKLEKGSSYVVAGTLSIKGITKPISFPATIELKDGKLAAYAEVKVDRTLYDIKYGSGKFFEGLGDKMIDDEFIVKFKIAAE